MSDVHQAADRELDRPSDTGMASHPPRSKLVSYLQLFRAPNVFTAIADVSMAYLVTARSIERPLEFVLIVAATSLLYSAGMVLNDVFDIEIDRVERPQRPLPAGHIPWRWARTLGFSMLVGGVILAVLAGVLSSASSAVVWRAGILAVLLAICIVAYDAGAKKTPIGPLVMGSCRFLNILLGMSLYAEVPDGAFEIAGFGAAHLLIAGGIGIYIVGVTIFARSEVSLSRRRSLILGVAVMALGVLMLALFPRFNPTAFVYRLDPDGVWPLAMLLISVWIFRRCLAAISRPEPMYVQAAIKFCLVSLIILDATLCMLVCPSIYGFSILALLVPTLTLGRWVYST